MNKLFNPKNESYTRRLFNPSSDQEYLQFGQRIRDCYHDGFIKGALLKLNGGNQTSIVIPTYCEINAIERDKLNLTQKDLDNLDRGHQPQIGVNNGCPIYRPQPYKDLIVEIPRSDEHFCYFKAQDKLFELKLMTLVLTPRNKSNYDFLTYFVPSSDLDEQSKFRKLPGE